MRADSAPMSPSHTEFDWAERYRGEDTPWDLGGPHPELELRIADGRFAPPRAGARALVPGCGRSYDAFALAGAGWDVVGVDYVTALQTWLPERYAEHGARFVLGDALAFRDDEPFDLIWDHTFFCAIHPHSREAYGQLARDQIVPGGHFVSLVFPANKGKELGGPPYGFDAEVLQETLGPDFTLTEDVDPERRVGRRKWWERVASYERS
jgi:methyl halide transferase